MLFFLNLVHSLLPYLNFLHNSSNYFFNASPVALLCYLLLSPLLVCTCQPSSLLLPLFSWQAFPTDVAAYVALTGPRQRAACARSGWLQVTSVFINRQIPPSIWEHSTDWEGEGEGGGRKWGRRRQTEGGFCVIYSRPWSRSCHLPCSVTATSLEGHWPRAPVTRIGFSN